MSSKTQTPTRVLFDVPGPKGRRRIWIISVLAVLVFVAAAAGGIYQLWWNYQLLPEKWLPFTQPATLKFFGRGVVGTLLATGVAALFTFPLALALALGREAKNRIVSKVSGAWVEVFRSLPLLLVIYAFMLALPRYGIRFSTFWLLVIPMIISCSATTAEVFRAGLGPKRGRTIFRDAAKTGERPRHNPTGDTTSCPKLAHPAGVAAERLHTRVRRFIF